MIWLNFHVISILTIHRAVYKNSHVEALCLWKDLMEKSKSEEILGKKRKERKKKTTERKKKTTERKKVPFCQEKKSFVKANSTGGTPRWRPDFEQRSRRQTKICRHNVENEVSFLYASTSLNKKTLTIASNRNFESRLSIRCLVPQHICRFFIFANFAHYCVVLLNALLSDRDRQKGVCRVSLSPRNLDPSPLKAGGPVTPLVAASGGEIISWRGASCLRTFMS